MKLKKIFFSVFLSTIPTLSIASNLPGPIQVNNGSGVATAVGWTVGGGTLPVHEIGTAAVSIQGTPTVTLSNANPIGVSFSTAPVLTVTGPGGPTIPVFVSTLPTVTTTGQGGPTLPVFISSLPTHGVTISNPFPLPVTISSGVTTGPGGPTIPVFVSSLPAVAVSSPGVNGSVSSSLETSLVYVGTTAYTVNFSTVNAANSGFNIVVSTVAGKRIMVIGWDLTVNGAVNFKWQSSSGPTTDLTGLYYGAAAGNGVARECIRTCFQTKVGEGLDLNLSGATAAGGSLQYILWP